MWMTAGELLKVLADLRLVKILLRKRAIATHQLVSGVCHVLSVFFVGGIYKSWNDGSGVEGVGHGHGSTHVVRRITHSWISVTISKI